ncbi:MAG: hypothetical protein GY906_38720 [bacterium]|nr:hypothetical protein [bacterium]
MSERVLKLDLDVPTLDFEELSERVDWTLSLIRRRATTIGLSESPSRHGWHVRIELNRGVSAMRAVALQAILGSDPKREAFNLARVSDWPQLSPLARLRWNVLFSRKVKL